MTDDKNHELFVIADAGASRRIPTAVALSLALNLLLLVGAGTLIRELPEPPAADAGYIFLDTVERESAEVSPVTTPAKAEPPPIIQPLSERRREQKTPPAPDQPRQISAPALALPKMTTGVSDGPNPSEKEAAPPQMSASPVPDAGRSADSAEAKVASSNASPGELIPVPGAGGLTPSPPAEPIPLPGAFPSPGTASEPVGVTKTAETAYHELPRIPDSLRESGYRSFVGVDVEVKEDGNFTVTVRTSSGNPDVDGRVLDALKRWKWKPALKNGVPVTSVESFRFDFGVD